MNNMQQIKTLETKIRIIELKQQAGQWADAPQLEQFKQQLAELKKAK